MLEVRQKVETQNCRNAPPKLCSTSVHPGLSELQPDGGTHMASHSLFPQSHCGEVYHCHPCCLPFS